MILNKNLGQMAHNDMYPTALRIAAILVSRSLTAGDSRLMNTGPRGGIREITVQPLQMGSIIMPGKVNLVIPEMVGQTSIRTQANDLVITVAASCGEFELNVFLPFFAASLLESVCLLERRVVFNAESRGLAVHRNGQGLLT
jgi:aspartate ammonia-lyase